QPGVRRRLGAGRRVSGAGAGRPGRRLLAVGSVRGGDARRHGRVRVAAAAAGEGGMSAVIEAFFDSQSFTYSYVVSDPGSGACAIIDPVLDYDAAAGRIGHAGADRLLAHVRERGLRVDWLLETH